MKRIVPVLVAAAMLLSACGVLNPAPAEPTPSDDQLATRVAQVLTAMPSATQAEALPSNTPPPTDTPVPPTEAPQPTATLIPSETPTLEPTVQLTGDAGGGGPDSTQAADMGGGGPSTTETADAGGGGPSTTGTPDAGGGGPALPTPPPTVGPVLPTPPPTVIPLLPVTTTPDAGGGGPNQPTPPATVTPVASDVRNRLGVPAFTDPMDNGNNWPTGVDPAGFTSVTFADGQMQLTGLKTTSGWRMSTYGADLSNFYIEARITPGECKGNDRYGIYFRVPNRTAPDQGYWYGFTCDGRFALQRWDGKAEPDGVVTNIIFWKKSDFIQAGPNKTNTLGVMAIGSRIYLYANGQVVGQADNNTWLQGAFGVFVGGRETPNFTIKVDEINVWTNTVAP